MNPEIHLALVAIALLATTIGHNPACSVAALFALLAYWLAEKYFHASVYDEHKKELSVLKGDLEKLKAKQNLGDLKSAFGGLK